MAVRAPCVKVIQYECQNYKWYPMPAKHYFLNHVVPKVQVLLERIQTLTPSGEIPDCGEQAGFELVSYLVELQHSLESSMSSFTGGAIPALFRVSFFYFFNLIVFFVVVVVVCFVSSSHTISFLIIFRILPTNCLLIFLWRMMV